MHKRNVIAIILTALIFIAAALIGVSSVYRVSAVTLDVSVISEAAKGEADELQRKLAERYRDESIFFVEKQEAEEEFAAFPYFRMVSFKKTYPNRLVIQASEDAELFAVDRGNGYYILGGDGTILGVREDAANRSDGADNIVVTGLSAFGEKGELLGGDENISYLLTLCSTVSLQLDGLRSNVLSIEVTKPTSVAKDVSFCLSMREGVKVYVRNPQNLTEKKASAFVSLYLSLKSEERLGGRIEVTDDALNPGEVRVSYSKK